MLRIKKNNLICMSFLFFGAMIYICTMLANEENLIVYCALLALVTISILFNNHFELISPAALFTAYYIYSIAAGPIILMSMGRFYRYGYTKIILGGLLVFAFGNGMFLLLSKKNIIAREDRPQIRFSFSRIKAIYILLVFSWSAAIYYYIKNRHALTGNIEDGRISAISGNGALLYTAQVSILLTCMLFDIYIETKKSGKPIINRYEMIFVTIFSAITLLVSGFRSPVATLFICMIVMYAGKHKMHTWKIFLYGLLCIIGVAILGVIRSLMSGVIGKGSLALLLSSLYVGDININYMYQTFPGKVPFQYGYTYLINFLMLLPGPDLDFTLWLKEQVGITFSGGGLTPTIIGEFYINFGEIAIFIGMFLMGVFSGFLNSYFKRHKESFLAVFYVWQFAHCVSGGIANVSITVVLYTIVYKCLIMLPYKNVRR